jgi:hypothetical protein
MTTILTPAPRKVVVDRLFNLVLLGQTTTSDVSTVMLRCGWGFSIGEIAWLADKLDQVDPVLGWETLRDKIGRLLRMAENRRAAVSAA